MSQSNGQSNGQLTPAQSKEWREWVAARRLDEVQDNLAYEHWDQVQYKQKLSAIRGPARLVNAFESLTLS